MASNQTEQFSNTVTIDIPTDQITDPITRQIDHERDGNMQWMAILPFYSQNRITMFKKMQELNIKTILVTFDGEGDIAHNKIVSAPDTPEWNKLHSAPTSFIRAEIKRIYETDQYNHTKPVQLGKRVATTEYAATIEFLALYIFEQLMDHKHKNWNADQGGFGTLTFDSTTTTATLEFNKLFVDSRKTIETV